MIALKILKKLQKHQEMTYLGQVLKFLSMELLVVPLKIQWLDQDQPSIEKGPQRKLHRVVEIFFHKYNKRLMKRQLH